VCGNIYPVLANCGDVPVVGGAEVQQYLIGNELASRGVEVSYVTEDFGQGVETTCGNFRVLAYQYDRNKVWQGFTIWRALCLANADVYYLRGIPKFLGLLLLYYAWRHHPFVIGMTSNCNVYPRRNTGLAWPYYLVYRLALATSKAVVAQTEFQREYLEQNYGVHNALVIRNGSFINPFNPMLWRDQTVVWVGTLYPYKGIEKVFELAQILPELQFEIIGGPGRGSEAYYDQMQLKAHNFGNIQWRGLVPNNQIDSEISGVLALINTTVTYQGIPNLEGFPNVYLEAWRNGVPTLTLNNDPDEVIHQNSIGYRCWTVEKMAADLARLASDTKARQQMGQSARDYVEQEHDMTKVADQYLVLFKKLVGKS
jgi:glycosyltransferase involved in cell wall biosynthesis